MAKICIKREHQISREEAREKLEQVADTLRDKLEAECSWDGDTMKFKRRGASGSVDIRDRELEFNVNLSLALTPLKGTIEKIIHEELDKSLA